MRARLIALSLMLTAYTANAQDLVGPAVVVDAQTLIVGTTQVELFGVIAPKLEQPCYTQAQTQTWLCGERAADVLNEWVLDTEITCQLETAPVLNGQYRCTNDDGDLGRRLIEEGWALASLAAAPDYHEQEARAREARLGIFRSGFEPNNAWRLWASGQADDIGCGVCTLRKQSITKRKQSQ